MPNDKQVIDYDKLKHLRILYVEDSEAIRDGLTMSLKMDIKTIYTARNGQEGLEMYRQYKPDAIISDIRMPVMDGLEMIKQIREEDLEIPILITTAFNESEYLLEAIELGVDGYVTKPLDIDKLLYLLYKNTKLFFEKRENQAKNTLLQLVMAQNPEMVIIIQQGNVEFASDAWKQCGLRDCVVYEDVGRVLCDSEGVALGESWEEKLMGMKEHVVCLLEKGKPGRYLSVNALCILENRSLFYSFHDITQIKQEYDVLSENYHETREMMAFQSKLASMGEMIEAIAHQWRQPLHVINLSVFGIEMELSSDELNHETVKESLDECKEQVRYMNQTINDFRGFIQSEKIERHFYVRHSIDQIFTLFGKQYRHAKMDVEVIGEDIRLFGRQNEFQHVMINLLNNTRDALMDAESNGGKVQIELKQTDNQNLIIYRDDAGGIPEEVLKRMFEERITTKGDSGTGIGMLMCKRIISEGMSGEIKAINITGGAEITMSFPLGKERS